MLLDYKKDAESSEPQLWQLLNDSEVTHNVFV